MSIYKHMITDLQESLLESAQTKVGECLETYQRAEKSVRSLRQQGSGVDCADLREAEQTLEAAQANLEQVQRELQNLLDEPTELLGTMSVHGQIELPRTSVNPRTYEGMQIPNPKACQQVH